MGRRKFTELYEKIQGPSFIAGYEAIYLYGSSGSGKSHILAALVCQLIREGNRVVYIPDCAQLLNDFASVIQSALYFAFFDSEPHLGAITSAQKEEDLFKFWDKNKDVYFVVDQLNALELGGSSSALDNDKAKVTKHLRKMKYGRKYIFSASANEKLYQEAASKQSGVTVIRMNGGMTEVCLCSLCVGHRTHLI
jgi:Cdc6-like AAA superfamily ATPase